jgi:isopentenyl diphosphate isomerase/L-lactate dehydrogenase-like FMN-dependent dehydrogenase
VFWGVAVGGPSGVARVIELMTEELKRTMMFTGVKDVRAVDRNILIFD